MPVLQPHACWVSAPGSSSPLDEILFLEAVTYFLQKYFHSINTFFLGYQITLCTGNSALVITGTSDTQKKLYETILSILPILPRFALSSRSN